MSGPSHHPTPTRRQIKHLVARYRSKLFHSTLAMAAADDEATRDFHEGAAAATAGRIGELTYYFELGEAN
jgi:hypothetical protein